MCELIWISLFLPLFTGVLSLAPVKLPLNGLNLTGGAATAGVLASLVYRVATEGTFHAGMFYVDELSAILLLVVAILSFTAIVFSLSYMRQEVAKGHIAPAMLPRYYALLQVFIFTMIGVLIVENLGIMWVAIEATTLASALLVAFYFNHSALEAAWKYVMVCTVGICLALLGTILLYYAQVSAIGEEQALSWLVLKGGAKQFDPAMVKLAFIFIVIGYGTKAGLAPMHTWLPDAHSQAPSPVSGLLSGALLSCALYAILRNMIIVEQSLGMEFSRQLLLGFGVFSVAFSVPFILVQHDIKRLLAYSSVEHIGLISVGLGIGTPLAVFGALVHIINHALAKSSLFYLAGIITQEYRTKHILRIRGMIGTMPLIGTLFFLAVIAITGTPPFGVFISKITIIWAAFQTGSPVLGGVILLFLAGIFAGMIFYSMKMCFGAAAGRSVNRPARSSVIAVAMSLGGVLVTGFYMPAWLGAMITRAAAIVTGG